MRISRILTLLAGLSLPTVVLAESPKAPLKPFVQVVDLNVGESAEVELTNGTRVTVKLLALKETRDTLRNAVRKAVVTVEVDGRRVQLVSATYHLPVKVGGVRIDCSVTKGYNSNGSPAFWGLDKDARLRLWPADSPLLRPGTFRYPVRQRWFATETQMANVPTFVDGGESPARKNIYYHSGLDIGGAEGLVEVIAATDGIVVSSGQQTLEEHKRDTPVSPRYDVVYLLDKRGWYYRYSHLKEIDKTIVPGRVIKMGDRVGLLGKEGGSGGWSHLHFEIKSRQPSGKWGTQEGYAFLWEAYLRENRPKLIAVARPHHLIWSGGTVTLDGTKSYSADGGEVRFDWRFHDSTTANGSQVMRTYSKPGRYNEIMQVTDSKGRTAYDFATVLVVDKQHPDRLPPTIHAAYSPTSGIKPGDEITFKVRTFGTTDGKETWNFGDGSPEAETKSDGNVKKLDPNGYAVIRHRYKTSGDYIVTVKRTDRHGVTATTHLHVRVGRATRAE